MTLETIDLLFVHCTLANTIFGICLKLLNYYSLLQLMFPLISLGFGIQVSMMPPMVSLLPGLFGKPEMTVFSSYPLLS